MNKKNNCGRVCSICGEITFYGAKPYEESNHDSISECLSALKYSFDDKLADMENLIKELRSEIGRVRDGQ